MLTTTLRWVASLDLTCTVQHARLVISLYTTDASSDKLTQKGEFYNITKLWRMIVNEHSGKQEVVDFVGKIEVVLWLLDVELYHELYLASYEWISKDVTAADLRCEMVARTDLETDPREGHALHCTHF